MQSNKERKNIQANLIKKWVDGRNQRHKLIEWMIPKISYDYREVSPEKVKERIHNLSNKYKIARSSIIPVIKIQNQNFWLLGSFREKFKGERILSDFGGTCKYSALNLAESPLDCALRETKEETKGLLNDAIEKAIDKDNYTIFEGIAVPNISSHESSNYRNKYKHNIIYFYIVFVDYKDIKDLPATYLKSKRLVKERLGPLGFYLQDNILNRVHRTARNLTDFVSFLNNYKK